MDDWIHGCLSSIAFEVLIYGESNELFKGQGGVRIRDPLYPLSFYLCCGSFVLYAGLGFRKRGSRRFKDWDGGVRSLSLAIC